MIINAVVVGTPQKRERVFIVGMKLGYPLPRLPSATHKVVRGIRGIDMNKSIPNCKGCLDCPANGGFVSEQVFATLLDFISTSDYVTHTILYLVVHSQQLVEGRHGN